MRSRYANRRSPEDQQRWNAEKAESEVHPSRPRAVLLENPSFDPRVCGECLQRDCACECTDCDARGSDVVKGRCETCREVHAMQVLREQAESLQMSEHLLMQMRMAGL